MKFFPTGGPPLVTIKCVMATAMAIGGAAMGSEVATGGLPWVVSTCVYIKNFFSLFAFQFKQVFSVRNFIMPELLNN